MCVLGVLIKIQDTELPDQQEEGSKIEIPELFVDHDDTATLLLLQLENAATRGEKEHTHKQGHRCWAKPIPRKAATIPANNNDEIALGAFSFSTLSAAAKRY